MKSEYLARRKALRDALPALAQRVFALRDKHYSGCGFHWGKERAVGGLLYRVNNFDSKYSFEDLLVDEVVFEDLVDQVSEVERQLAEGACAVCEATTGHAVGCPDGG